ncbi:phage antirepressor KilAC domain-containing protein, partial [Staphylococcus aureus]|uniref:phage antirepressor KilAC domain-containing protein n=1 Tax=Staphylococcus aureus TaxID=1280 RepID=UPI003D9C7484
EHMGKSYTESDTIPIVRSDGREDTVLQTRWTQKGRLKIHEIITEFSHDFMYFQSTFLCPSSL